MVRHLFTEECWQLFQHSFLVNISLFFHNIFYNYNNFKGLGIIVQISLGQNNEM